MSRLKSHVLIRFGMVSYHRGVIRSNHYYCGSSPKCEADRCIVTGTGQSALSLLLYTYLHNSADSGIGAGTGQTVLSLLLYTYLLTFWAAPTIVMVASNHAVVTTHVTWPYCQQTMWHYPTGTSNVACTSHNGRFCNFIIKTIRELANDRQELSHHVTGFLESCANRLRLNQKQTQVDWSIGVRVDRDRVGGVCRGRGSMYGWQR